MSNLIEAYEGYYEDPNPNTAKSLWNQVQDYEFTDFDADLNELQRLAEENPIFTTLAENDIKTTMSEIGMSLFTYGLTTNGSTNNQPQAYAFHPEYNFWRENITNHLRNPESISNELNMENKPKSSEATIELFKKNFDKKGPMWLSGRPADFIFPTTDPKTADYIRANSDKIRYLTTYDTEPLLRSVTHHNDQMIDWSSGFNFRTCQFNNKHILPTFSINKDGEVRNMLNLNPGKVFQQSDVYNPKEFFKCKCGKIACQLEFLPHAKKAIRNKNGEPFYLPGLMNDLKGSYLNLQFLQEENGGKVSVYVLPDKVPSSDYDYIRDVLRTYDLDSELEMNRYFMVGRKIMHFWQAERSKVKELYGKMM